MAIQVIGLPNGRKCGLGTYVKAWKALKAAQPAERIAGFGLFPEPAADILREMRYGMMDRINRKVPGFGCGRKWDSDYQASLFRDSRRLQDMAKRVRVYQFETIEARSRFADRLASRDD